MPGKINYFNRFFANTWLLQVQIQKTKSNAKLKISQLNNIYHYNYAWMMMNDEWIHENWTWWSLRSHVHDKLKIFLLTLNVRFSDSEWSGNELSLWVMTMHDSWAMTFIVILMIEWLSCHVIGPNQGFIRIN